MQYALLIYERPGAADSLTEEERTGISEEYWALRDDPRVVGGAGLKPVETATTVRVQEAETLVTDGPFANTKEVFGGFYTIEVDNLDAAIQLASRIPAARLGGSVEIRPLVEAPR